MFQRKTKRHFILINSSLESFFILTPGPDLVLDEKWLNISGDEIKDLTSDPRYPDNATESGYRSLFKDNNLNEVYFNHGARYRSYFQAQETGNYTFYTFCDDSCRLYLSSDVNPRCKKTIINQTKRVSYVNESNCCRYNYLCLFIKSTAGELGLEN